MRRRQIPLLTVCRDCAKTHRAYTPGALCDACARKVRAQLGEGESLREFRQRLKPL